MADLPRHGYATTAVVAEHLGVSPSWVRANAAELGGTRVAGLRFDVARVREYVEARRVTPTAPASRRRPGPKVGAGRAIPADVREW